MKPKSRQQIVDEKIAARRGAGPSMREIHSKIHDEIYSFAAKMAKKYSSYHGKDYRKQVSHLLEGAGMKIHDEVESVKRLERERLRAENIAASKVATLGARDAGTP